MQLIMDGDYVGAGLNPDSLLADVEALLAQERLLTQQTKWWEDRAERELEHKKSLQAELQNQEAAFNQEVQELRREIANIRAERRQELTRAEQSSAEAADLREEAAAVQDQAEMLRERLEQATYSRSSVRSSGISSNVVKGQSTLRTPMVSAASQRSSALERGSTHSNVIAAVGPTLSPRGNSGFTDMESDFDFESTIRVAPTTPASANMITPKYSTISSMPGDARGAGGSLIGGGDAFDFGQRDSRNVADYGFR
jgi:hypothetical protein